MSIVVDFAWTKPTVAQLKSWGATAVGMYISHDPTKNANHSLISAYAQASIKTFLFFEDSATNAKWGYSTGHADAVYALSYATNQLNMPSWAPIFPAADYDVPDYAPNSDDPVAKMGPVGEYLRAWNDVIGFDRTGVYGSYYACLRAIAARRARYAIQTIAWSGGQVDTKDIVLFQNGGMLDSGHVDVEQIVSAELFNHIAWIPGESNPVQSAPPAQPLPRREKTDMLHLKVTAPADSGTDWSGKTRTFLYQPGQAPVHIVDAQSENAIAAAAPPVDITWSFYTSLGGM